MNLLCSLMNHKGSIGSQGCTNLLGRLSPTTWWTKTTIPEDWLDDSLNSQKDTIMSSGLDELGVM